MGAALHKKDKQINRQSIDEAFASLRSYDKSIHDILRSAHEAGLMTTDELVGAFVAEKATEPIKSLGALYKEVFFADHLDRSDFVVEAFEGGLISEEMLKTIPYRRMSDLERGRRLQRAVERCSAVLRIDHPDPDSDPFRRIIQKLAVNCFNVLKAEFSRLGILKLCAYCQKPFFPTKPHKQFCSGEYEGRNCGGNYRSRQHYYKQKS
jgi:hypothetical protein